MWKLIAIFILAIPCAVAGQTPCPQYSTMIQKGQQALNSNDPTKAFEYFRNAQIEGKLCHLKSTIDADNGIMTAFKALEKLKNQAVESEKRAVAEEQRVKETLSLLSKEREEKNKLIEDNRNKHTKLLEMGIDPQSLSGIKEKAGGTNAGPSTTYVSTNGNTLNTEAYVSRLGFYVRAKSVLDSVDAIARAKKAAFINTIDDEESISSVTGRLELGNADTRFSKFLMDSARSALQKQGTTNAEFLVFVYSRAVLYYGWKLTELRKFDSAKLVLDEGIRYVENIKTHPAIIHYAVAGLHNGYWNYSRYKGDEKEAYRHISKSIEEISTAISINPYNSVYQRSLSVLLRNARNTPDSLLAKEDKDAIFSLGCQCAYNALSYFPKSGASLDAPTTCAIEEASNLISKAKYNEAIASLRKTVDKVSGQLNFTPEKKDIFLQKSRLYVNISDIYIRNLGDTVSSVKYLDSSFMSWDQTFKNEVDPIVYTADAATVFDRFVDVIYLLNQSKYRQKYNEAFLKSISGYGDNYKAFGSLRYIAAMANRNLGDMYESMGKKADTLKALDYFTKSIDILESSGLLFTYNYFAEDISNFCLSYLESVRINLVNGNYEKAADTYEKMMRSFSGFYKKYPFDFYLNQKLKIASAKYGEYLYNTGNYEKAIPALSLASYEADKRSTEKLIAILGDKFRGFYDTASLHVLEERVKFQGYEMKKFAIPTYFGKTNVAFDYYIVDRDSLYPYRGIDDQVEWVSKARGGYVTEEVRLALQRIQAIAWKSNLSYAELTAYALDEINKQKALQKYTALKDSISKTNKVTTKLGYYEELYAAYEADINKGGDYREVIVKDALDIYNQYATYLIKSGKPEKAEKIIQRVNQLDRDNGGAYENQKRIEFARKKSEILSANPKPTISDEKLYLQFSLEDLDFETAHKISGNILEVKSDPQTKEEVSDIYFRFTGDPNLQHLFLRDTIQLLSYYNYLSGKGINSLKTDDEKRVRYRNLVDLEEAMMTANVSNIDRTIVASHYNSLAWFGLLTKHYDGIFSYLNRSIALDSTSPYPIGNYPHAYLFTNNFERAKALYLKLKDQPFDNTNGLPKYKDAFLADFKDFEKVGMLNDDLKEITRLLEEK